MSIILEEIARWVGKSGFANHIEDKDRAWRFCVSEAQDLMEYLYERNIDFKIIPRESSSAEQDVSS